MKSRLLALLFSVPAFMSFGQVGVFGGASIVKGFGQPGIYQGINFGVEVPRDDMTSFFGRVVMTLPYKEEGTIQATAIDPATTFPSIKDVPCEFRNSVFNLQFGTRYYVGNGYDYGLSAYGGSIFEVGTVGVSRKVDKDAYDEEKYALVNSENQEYANRGRIISFNLGLNAGVKYNFMFGVLFFDVSGSYSLFPISSNALSSAYGRFAYVNFGFNLGYRKDIF